MNGAQQALALIRLGTGDGAAAGVEPETVALEQAEGLAAAAVAAAAGARTRPEWHEAHRRTAVASIVALQEVAEAARMLAAADLPVVLLPGAALLRFYPDAGCRPMDDIDLLCPPGQSEAVAEWLRRHGWTSVARHADLLSGRHAEIDLHEDLFHCERIAARRHAGWLDPRQVWLRRQRVCLEGMELLALGAEDEVIYTAAHALRHSYRRVTWLIDLALQLRHENLDARILRARAETCGLARPVLFGVALLRAGRVQLPAEIVAWYDECAPGVVQQRLLMWILGARDTTCAGELLWYWSAPGWRARGRLLLEFVFPRTEVLLQVFPRVPRILAPLAYALRCGQLLQRIAVEFVALLTPMRRRAKRG